MTKELANHILNENWDLKMRVTELEEELANCKDVLHAKSEVASKLMREKYSERCEICAANMTKEEHNECDICAECCES